MKTNTHYLKIFSLIFLMILFTGSTAVSQTKKKPTGSGTQKKSTSASQGKKSTGSSSIFQNKSVIQFRPGQIDTFQVESVQLVRFLQSMLNFLADGSNAVKDKQTIINQSYLKIFMDLKV